MEKTHWGSVKHFWKFEGQISRSQGDQIMDKNAVLEP